MTTIQSMILESYYPVMKINLNTEEFEEINAVTNTSIARSSITQQYFNFAQDFIFPADVQDFLQFMNIYNNIKYFDKNPSGRKVCYYRLLANNQYHWIHAELRPDKGYGSENRILYLIEKEAGGEPRIEKILANARSELGASSEFTEKIASFRERFPTSLGLILIKTTDPLIKDTLTINHGGDHCYQYSTPNTYAVLLEDLTPEDFSEDLMNLFSFLRGYSHYALGTCWSDDEDLGIDYVINTALNKLEKFENKEGGNEE